jgi:hypothetical protein
MRQGETFSVGNEQVVVADRRAIRMHALDGTLLRRLTIGEYVTDLAHNDEELIVYTYPGPKRQGVFRVLGAEGRELAKWTVAPAVAGFSIVAADDGPAILTVTKDGFALQSTEGRELRRFPVALGKGFARALGTKLSGDTWVLVAVGSGYHSKTSVTVFTGDRLVYRDDVEGRSYALTASGDDSFVVGIENEIWKYSLPRPHGVP